MVVEYYDYVAAIVGNAEDNMNTSNDRVITAMKDKGNGKDWGVQVVVVLILWFGRV